MNLRTPLSQARGLGAAKEGASHWWHQRLTALALVPLVLWFAFAVASIGHADHATLTAWVGSPFVTVLLILLIGSGCYHMQLGMQVILEDYIHTEWLKLSSVIASNFASVLLAVIGIVSVLKISFAA
ncbi:MAG: succinate dehydrogenase, hydrophobic membrane anchor protein [Gammaproteobacteria bacterium]